jgi:NDP-sugar pyrophosphorylase family protein
MSVPNPNTPWRAGVIAAGLGERLQQAGGASDAAARRLKPLVSVAGRTLIEHVLSSIAEVRPAEVVIIVNDASLAVKDHVSSRSWPFAITWIVETTPSSMHSFLRVLETLAAGDAQGPFLMSTVDTIAPRGAFAEFATAVAGSRADITLAIAPPPDDEKPLLVELSSEHARSMLGNGSQHAPSMLGATGKSLPVRAIGKAAAGSEWATSGYYAVRASVLREADAARRDGLTALRAFLERLLVNGYAVEAVPVAAGIDVDRPADIHAAEAFLRQAGA